MSIDLMQMIRTALPDNIEDQLGGLLGTDSKQAGEGLTAALPTLLGGLINKTGSAQGAQEIFDQVKDDDGGLLDNLSGLLGGGAGGGIGDVISKGSGLLGSIFGAQQSGILGLLGRVTGLGNSPLGMLLGVLGPVVMGVLGKHQAASGLDAGGLTSLLAGQKGSIAKALPAGMGDMLGFASTPQAPKPVVTQTTPPPRPALQREPVKSGGGLGKILIPLLLLGALGYWAFNHFNKPADVAGTLPGKIDQRNVALPDATLPDLAPQVSNVTDLFGQATTALAGVTNEASAQAAIPTLESVTTGLGAIDTSALPEQAQGLIGKAAQTFAGSLQPVMEKLEAIPGVGPILKPVVDSLLEKVAALGG
ncbi:MAG: DUF937 domain-containing protein [Algisphaera sp.]